MSKNSDYIDRIQSRLYTLVEDRAGEILEAKATRLLTALDSLQELFFIQLANNIIGADAPPDLGQWKTQWAPLRDKKYIARKEKLGLSGFYRYSGKLEQSLLRSKARTSFGKPLVYITLGGTYNNQRRYEKSTGVVVNQKGKISSLKNVKNLKFTISIDLYPKIKEDIRKGNIPEGEYLSKIVALRLTNYRGKRLRPIFTQYLNWWLDVKAKQTVNRVLHG